MRQAFEFGNGYGLHVLVVTCAVLGALVVNVAGLYLAPPSIGVITATSVPVAERTITGAAIALGGRFMRVDGRTVGLFGIDAPEVNQSCRNAYGRYFRCGGQVRAALRRLTLAKRVSCTVKARNADGQDLAQCSINGKDLAADLVRRGLALAAAEQSPAYATLESKARTAKIGYWAYSNESPDAYRARIWAHAARQRRDRCPIKADIRKGQKRFYLPWSRGYWRISVISKRGERWFCSVAEARAAGWLQAG